MYPDQLLQREKYDLGPYCLQYRLAKNRNRSEEHTTSRERVSILAYNFQTHKAPRKNASDIVVCRSHLLQIIAKHY